MPKRIWDSIDIQVEAESNAIRRQLTQQIARRAMGKQIIKQRKMHTDGTYAVQRRVVKCVEKEV